jgi:hypothetical protein
MESTFDEARQCLGFETQRHWSERAIQRTAAPALLGLLFSLVALLAHHQKGRISGYVRRAAAWYDKPHRTFFSDALALVRKELWAQETFYGSPQQDDTVKVSREFVERLTDAVCYAA